MTWAVEVYATYKKVRIIRQLLSRDKEEVMAENNVRKKKKKKKYYNGTCASCTCSHGYNTWNNINHS